MARLLLNAAEPLRLVASTSQKAPVMRTRLQAVAGLQVTHAENFQELQNLHVNQILAALGLRLLVQRQIIQIKQHVKTKMMPTAVTAHGTRQPVLP